MYPKADKPTMYFIGVTTGKSSIMKVFPQWAKALGLGDCVLKGIDFRPHDEPQRYREAVEHIKYDQRSLGALVTTHKIDLLQASRDLFDDLDPYARTLGEISSISKCNGRLAGHAKDPITSGLALEDFVPAHYWNNTQASLFLMGAGGSSLALTCYLMNRNPDQRPKRIIVSNRSEGRLLEMQKKHREMGMNIPCEYVLAADPRSNDDVLARLEPQSVVVNATGLGKDAPGSPLTDAAVFPESAIAWDFNYRGNLVFLDQSRRQQESRQVRIIDGWVYFLHGWTQVIAEVFHIAIPSSGPEFENLSEIARQNRQE